MSIGEIVQHTQRTYTDETTGREVTQLTSVPGNHHHLYFTSTSFTKDNGHVLYISDLGDGSPNIYKLSLQDGSAVKVTDNRGGSMKGYVYYDGIPYKGLAKASPSFNPATNTLAYIQDQDVKLVQLDTLETKTVYKLPRSVMTGFTHISTDGKYICVPYISSAAFEVGDENPFRNIRDKVNRERIESQMLVIDTASGEGEIRFSQAGWITHVQFHPHDSGIILYNHEGGMVAQRIWLHRDGQIVKVRDQSTYPGQLWICHEMWSRDGQSILYHGSRDIPNRSSSSARVHQGSRPDSVSFVGCSDLASGEYVELDFPESMKAYGHFTESGDSGCLITDGVIDQSSLHLCRADWKGGKLSYTRLCGHNSSFSVQDVHPHPIFSHDSRMILFTSDAHNVRTKGHLYKITV